MEGWLTRAARVRRFGADCRIVFAADSCPGCDGRCRLSIGDTSDLPVDADLPDGATVEVLAPPRAVSYRAWRVFGLPVTAVVVAAFVADRGASSEALVAVALIAALVTVVGLRYVLGNKVGEDALTKVVVGDPAGVRIVLE